MPEHATTQIKASTLIYKHTDGTMLEITPARNRKYQIDVVNEKSGEVLQSGFMPIKKVGETIRDCKYVGIKGGLPRSLFVKKLS